MEKNNYKAVFFDLDGTLLPMDMDLFLKQYFKKLGYFAATRGYDGEKFLQALLAGTGAMTNGYPAAGEGSCSDVIVPKSDGTPNSQRFWNTFTKLSGITEEEAEPMLMDFYTGPFTEIGKDVEPNPFAAKAVQVLKEKGYTLYVTTMPLFPEVAVVERLRWAGLDAKDFERLTTYDNSTSTKPFLDYYYENIKHVGLEPEQILMVGNNTREDFDCLQTGMDGYLVTEWLLNPNEFDIETMKHGTMEDFYNFVCELPECE